MIGPGLVALALIVGTLATPMPITDDDRACFAIPRKTEYCNPRLARWLPHDFHAFDGWRRGDARLNTPPDRFVIVHEAKALDFPESTGLERKTEGPETMGVDAVDPVHHRVFIHTYCCGAEYRMLATTTGPAPARLPVADLSAVRTRGGIRLGMSSREVIAKRGWTRRYRLAGHPGMTFIDYVTMQKKAASGTDIELYAGHCPDGMLIALRNDRVVSIALEQSC